jgi:hypothetical protein
VAEVQKHKPKLVAAWSYSHVIFAGSMFAAPFVTSLRAATAIVALCGMCVLFPSLYTLYSNANMLQTMGSRMLGPLHLHGHGNEPPKQQYAGAQTPTLPRPRC